MLQIGDTVKVIRKILNRSEKELIPIGTICRIVGCYYDDKIGLVVGIRSVDSPWYFGEYWCFSCDVEKVYMEMGRYNVSKFKVEIVETYRRYVEVEAENEDAAWDDVSTRIENGELSREGAYYDYDRELFVSEIKKDNECLEKMK